MAKRLQGIVSNIEYVDTSNKRRLQDIAAMVEMVDTSNKRRLHSLVVMVEYTTGVQQPVQQFGPKWQMM